MTQIEIVDLLKESGVWDEIGYPTCIDKLIDLVAAHEREKQAEQEPVAKRFEKMHANGDVWITTIAAAAIARNAAPVRTKDLTDDEILQMYTMTPQAAGHVGFARAVIAAYKEKNK